MTKLKDKEVRLTHSRFEGGSPSGYPTGLTGQFLQSAPRTEGRSWAADLQFKLEQMNRAKEALQNEVEAKKLELRDDRKLLAVAKTNWELESDLVFER